MHKLLLVLFLLIPAVISCTQEVGDVPKEVKDVPEEVGDVPKELFGIKLGSIYDSTNVTRENVGNLPIKQFTGSEQSFGIGTHFYFEPLKESKYFPYTEKKKTGNVKFFNTSYRLYLLPVIPDSIKTIEELSASKFDMEVALIEWSDEKKDEEKAYFWAMEMCKIFSSDTKTKPEIFDNYESKDYFCKFKKDNRMLDISSLSNSVYFKLQYDKEFMDKKTEQIEEKIRKLKLKDILKK